MIKTELIGMEYGWEIGDAGDWKTDSRFVIMPKDAASLLRVIGNAAQENFDIVTTKYKDWISGLN